MAARVGSCPSWQACPLGVVLGETARGAAPFGNAMLITFRSKAGSEVLMLSEHAGPLLRAAGKSFPDQVPERGVFTPEQLQAAIAGIEKAIALAPAVKEEDDDDDKPPVHPVSQKVSLQQRAFPLLDLMKKSLAMGTPLSWEAASPW